MTEIECECKTQIEQEFPFYLNYKGDQISYCDYYEKLKTSPDIEIYYMRNTKLNRTIKGYEQLTYRDLFELIRRYYGNILRFVLKINDGTKFKVISIDYSNFDSSLLPPNFISSKLKDLPKNLTITIYI